MSACRKQPAERTQQPGACQTHDDARQQHTAQVGEIVVALTDEDKNTLKRLLYDDDRQSYYLHPENKDMEDIYVSGLRVQGGATHVIKAL